MSFSPDQINDLKAPLDRRHVKSRSQAGRSLSYVEGWHAIAEANRIFGFGEWDRETLELRQLGDAREVDGKWRVAYLARVRVTVTTSANNDVSCVRRDGCGYGSGIDRDLGSAHESALKEAETDAMKRALMTFGNPFGLALYDKDQTNVSDAPDESKVRFLAECRATIATFKDPRELMLWWSSEDQKKQRRDFALTPPEVEDLKDAVVAHRDSLPKPQEVA